MHVNTLRTAGGVALLLATTAFSTQSSLRNQEKLPDLPEIARKGLAEKKPIYTDVDWEKVIVVFDKALKHAEGQIPLDPETKKKLYEPVSARFSSKGLDRYSMAVQELTLVGMQTSENFFHRDPEIRPSFVNNYVSKYLNKLFTDATEEIGK